MLLDSSPSKGGLEPPEADCHLAQREQGSGPLIDSGRGHHLTPSLHIKGLLSAGDSPQAYITSFFIA